MININLLPEALRKKERMPLQKFLGLIGAVLLFGLTAALIVQYAFSTIPELERRRVVLQRQKAELTEKVKELAVIRGEIGRLDSLIEAVRQLYQNRIVWSKILADLKNIVNFDATMSEYNQDMRYLWLTKFSGGGKSIDLNGFATATTQMTAMQMIERLLVGFLSYSPVNLPERDEEVRVQEELKQALMDYESLRNENPALPLQGPKEIALRQRLAEIKAVKSGGLAMKPFVQSINPSSLTLTGTTWGQAPRPSRAVSGTELYPANAWQFNIKMNLK